ncbi:Type 2 lactosamine alpha-2,3-sialyltransferase [Varanus komodoensis]|nr:Type 2 lactosamine alpha-2,3-sialyltransferase [Varanus komodoensis]
MLVVVQNIRSQLVVGLLQMKESSETCNKGDEAWCRKRYKARHRMIHWHWSSTCKVSQKGLAEIPQCHFLKESCRPYNHETNLTCVSPGCWSDVCYTALHDLEDKQLLDFPKRNLQEKLPPTDSARKEQVIDCTSKSSISTSIKIEKSYPFLCCHNFLQVSQLHESHNLELPYGIKKAERYFQMALSKLNNCGLFAEDDGSSSCKKCVVVGNGGVLRNRSLGETIDSYDVIIRMNNGPVLGYEEDVGRRTTFRLFYPESVFSDPIHYDPNTTAVLVVFKPHDLKWLWDLLSGQHVIYSSMEGCGDKACFDSVPVAASDCQSCGIPGDGNLSLVIVGEEAVGISFST